MEPMVAGKTTPYKNKVHTAIQVARDEKGKPLARKLPAVRPPSYRRAAVLTLDDDPGTTTV